MRRIEPSLVWPAAVVAGVVPLLAALPPLLRYDHILSTGTAWDAWPLTPAITLGTLVVVCLYIAGQRDAAVSAENHRGALRHLTFFAGVAAIFMALQSPIETLSDHLFIVHQVEHMLLRTVGPMLLMLAAPQAALLRGVPNWLRRRAVAPLLANRGMRALGISGAPLPATLLFIATTYFWMIPRWHDIAILDEPVHYLWHTTLLLSGLVFFWRVLDPRPYPLGASLGTRLAMFWFASLGNIVLGFYLTFKHRVLYHAYEAMGRVWGLTPIDDERLGGLLMWVMGGMMFAAAAMFMVHRWALQEDRAEARRRQTETAAASAAGGAAGRRAANRKTALGLVAFAAAVFIITFTVALGYRYAGIR